jgi:hypothetical protein
MLVAGFGHGPNPDAAAWLAKDIFPRILEQVPNARISIVGSNPTNAVRALATQRIEVAGRVSEVELRSRYARARLAVVPLRTRAGVKSKVVEALREGLPLVTTTAGAQGLPGIDELVSVADWALPMLRRNCCSTTRCGPKGHAVRQGMRENAFPGMLPAHLSHFNHEQ